MGGQESRECDVTRPCADDLVCNLTTRECQEESEEKGYVIAKIDGKRYTARPELMRQMISTLVSRNFDLKCTHGQDATNYITFGGEFVSDIERENAEDEVKVVSFIDVTSGRVLCENLESLLTWWGALGRVRGGWYNFPSFPYIYINNHDRQLVQYGTYPIFAIVQTDERAHDGDVYVVSRLREGEVEHEEKDDEEEHWHWIEGRAVQWNADWGAWENEAGMLWDGDDEEGAWFVPGEDEDEEDEDDGEDEGEDFLGDERPPPLEPRAVNWTLTDQLRRDVGGRGEDNLIVQYGERQGNRIVWQLPQRSNVVNHPNVRGISTDERPIVHPYTRLGLYEHDNSLIRLADAQVWMEDDEPFHPPHDAVVWLDDEIDYTQLPKLMDVQYYENGTELFGLMRLLIHPVDEGIRIEMLPERFQYVGNGLYRMGDLAVRLGDERWF